MIRVLHYAATVLLLATVIIHAELGEDAARAEESKRTESRPVDSTASTWSHSPSTSTPTRSGNATCISRTANYITHTLPQQCLRTNRVATNTSQPTGTSSGGMPLEPEAVSTNSSILATAEPTPERADFSKTTETASDGTASASGSYATVEITAASSPVSSSIPSPQPSESGIVVVKAPDSEPEVDSPLDNANFLSFEEWKKQNLAKVGQSPEHVGQVRPPSGDRQRPGINNALDALGEESEIDIDFAGFGSPRPSDASTERPPPAATSDSTTSGQTSPASNILRSKDAGRTCKERTNYASFDCAAGIMKSNPEGKSASSVLVESKDSYMLNKCTAQNKFLIIELCNDILIDTIVLANYEFFSSIFRHFRVSVSDRYPVKMEKWKDLGTFEARNTREVQAFLIENPLIWARYLRIEFLTHYGSEYYCPLSLLRVHGTTMMEEFRHQEEMARGETDEEPALEPEVISTPAVEQEPLNSTDEAEKATLQAITRTDSDEPSAVAEPMQASAATATGSDVLGNDSESRIDVNDQARNVTVTLPQPAMPSFSDTTSVLSSNPTSFENPTTSSASATAGAFTSHKGSPSSLATLLEPENGTYVSASSSESAVTESTGNRTVLLPSIATSNSTSNASSEQTLSTVLGVSSNASSTTSVSSSMKQAPSASSNGSSATLGNQTRSAMPSSTVPQQAQPSTQESFFKSMSKRLQQLESNSTLSLQYIEEQSRILRDAFQKVEKRQIGATATFLSHLNDTVMTELHGFRQAYDQLWQSTVIELEGQREQYQREMLALSTRLTLVADELVWQKRMGIVQSTLLLLCLSLVLFGRQANGYLEVPLAQQLMLKSQAALRSGWESEPNSPSPTSRSPVSLFRRKIWRSSTEPAGSNGNITNATDSRPGTRDGGVDVDLTPPTPTTDEAQSEAEESDEDELFEEVLTTQSGPATPKGTGAGLKRPSNWPEGGRARSPLRIEE